MGRITDKAHKIKRIWNGIQIGVDPKAYTLTLHECYNLSISAGEQAEISN